MKTLTIKRLQENFVGKVCTILTTTIAKTNFHDTQFSDFFTGIIESLDDDGIFARHHMTGCKNFYTWNHVVGLLEEQVIEETNPKFQEIIEEIRKTPPNQQAIVPVDPKASNSNPYIDPDFMANIIKKANEL